MTFYGDDNDRDLPLEQDMDRDDDDSLPEMMCPNCGGTVTEDTQKCPYCGDWITPVDGPRRPIRRRRWLFVAAVMIMLYAMFRFIIP